MAFTDQKEECRQKGCYFDLAQYEMRHALGCSARRFEKLAEEAAEKILTDEGKLAGIMSPDELEEMEEREFERAMDKAVQEIREERDNVVVGPFVDLREFDDPARAEEMRTATERRVLDLEREAEIRKLNTGHPDLPAWEASRPGSIVVDGKPEQCFYGLGEKGFRCDLPNGHAGEHIMNWRVDDPHGFGKPSKREPTTWEIYHPADAETQAAEMLDDGRDLIIMLGLVFVVGFVLGAWVF